MRKGVNRELAAGIPAVGHPPPKFVKQNHCKLSRGTLHRLSQAKGTVTKLLQGWHAFKQLMPSRLPLVLVERHIWLNAVEFPSPWMLRRPMSLELRFCEPGHSMVYPRLIGVRMLGVGKADLVERNW